MTTDQGEVVTASLERILTFIQQEIGAARVQAADLLLHTRKSARAPKPLTRTMTD